jgi:putative ABC transport system permease protein
MLFRYLFRHLLHHWRVNLLVFVGLLATAALLAGLPAYAATIAGSSLARRLADAPFAARNILITGSVLDEEFHVRLSNQLGDLIRERVVVRDQRVAGIPAIRVSESEDTAATFNFDEFFVLHLQSFSNLADVVHVLEGRLPQATGSQNGVLEAVIGAEAATSIDFSHAEGGDLTFYNLQIGDRVQTEDGRVQFEVVGIVKPKEPAADQWWGTLLPFSFVRQALNGPSMPETITLSLLVSPEAVAAHLPGYTEQWRVLTDMDAIDVNNANERRSALRTVETELETNLVNVETSLIELINSYFSELSTARTTLFLLSFQSLLFVFYLLALISALVVEYGRAEFDVLYVRGFSKAQVFLLYAASALLLALVAALLAPLLAQLSVGLWARLTGRTTAGLALVESWRIALAAAFAGWLMLIAVLLAATRGRLATRGYFRSQAPERPFWQRYYLDFVLLLVGGLLYWQASNNNNSLGNLSAVAGAADPLLLIGPTLLLIATALLVVRLFPWIIRTITRLQRGDRLRSGRFVSPYVLQRLGRDSLGTGRVVFLISLAAGLALFAALFRHSLTTRQMELAHYLNGADVRIGLPSTVSGEDGDAIAEWSTLPSVVDASPVYRHPRLRPAAQPSQQATLLAVDPASFGEVTRFAPGVSNLALADILPALETRGPEGIPAVFSYDSYPQDKQVGDIVTYIAGTTTIDFEVRGLIRSFPSLSTPFIVTNLELLDEEIALSVLLSGISVGQNELWVAAAVPAQRAALIDAAISRGWPVLNTAAGVEQTLQADLVGQETLGALSLNAWLLTTLSLVAFVLAGLLAARQRHYEFSILRTLGAAPRQLMGLIGVEGIIGLGLGLLAGTGIGYGLAVMMRPVLSRVLSAAVGGDQIRRLVIDWPELLQWYGAFVIAFAIMLLFLLLIISRSRVMRVLKVSPE